MKVGFIGLGSMGAGMSRNLIKAGHDLVVLQTAREASPRKCGASERKSPIPPRKQRPEWKCSSRCWLTIALCKM